MLPINADHLGLFKLQSNKHRGKATYKHETQEMYCFFVNGHWMFGKKVGNDNGYFIIREDSAKPDSASALVEAWANNKWNADFSISLVAHEDGIMLSKGANPGVRALANAIKNNGALTKLDISNNNIEQGEALQRIADSCNTKGIELDNHKSESEGDDGH
jgi:hypothetical protein